VDLTSPSSAPVERTSASVGRPEPIAADSETPPAATQPEVKAKRAPRPKLSKTLPADDDPDSPGWDVTVVTHTETDNYALSWCEIVGIPDDKRLETAVIAIHAGAKWKDLCGTAGTPEAVTTPALEELRKWRRDELVKVLGDDLADAYIAGIQAKQGF
jgi:hypothetical protein